MPRNIEIGINRVVTAKLRERGLPQASADTLAKKHAADALAYFNEQLLKHDHSGLTETSYEEAFADLAQWAAKLA